MRRKFITEGKSRGVMGVDFSKTPMKGVVHIPLKTFGGLKLKSVPMKKAIVRDVRLFRERK